MNNTLDVLSSVLTRRWLTVCTIWNNRVHTFKLVYGKIWIHCFYFYYILSYQLLWIEGSIFRNYGYVIFPVSLSRIPKLISHKRFSIYCFFQNDTSPYSLSAIRPQLELLEVADDGALGEIWKHVLCLKCPIPWRPLLVQRSEEALCLLIYALHIER